jgi:predicted MFS family arabinose efflux permease
LTCLAIIAATRAVLALAGRTPPGILFASLLLIDLVTPPEGLDPGDIMPTSDDSVLFMTPGGRRRTGPDPVSAAESDTQAGKHPAEAVSAQSRRALNAANFFLAEVTGVVMPFLAKFLGQQGWRDDAIGAAICLAGLGVFLMQTPAGFLVDRIRQRRGLLAGASLLLGGCFGLLPLIPGRWWFIDPLLFLGGTAQAFFAPLLGALALGLVGHAALNRTVGANQGWNHAGNIAAALTAMVLVGWFGTAGVFYAVLVVSVLAAASLFFIRRDEIDERRGSGITPNGGGGSRPVRFLELFRDRRVVILFAATALFHLANAPVMPLVGRYVDVLGGTNRQVAAVVLVAQAVMIPVAWASGWLCDRWGRKPVFTVGFLVLPLRIFCTP